MGDRDDSGMWKWPGNFVENENQELLSLVMNVFRSMGAWELYCGVWLKLLWSLISLFALFV